MKKETILFVLICKISFVMCFDCKDISQISQCEQLEGCSWKNNLCLGTYSPSCLPPECYYIDSSAVSTTNTGTPQDPLQSLSIDFPEPLDKTLIIINYIENVRIYMKKVLTFNTVTVKYIFRILVNPC